MEVIDFKLLQKEAKKEVLFKKGVYLLSRVELLHEIDLYQIDSFYVEAFYPLGDTALQYLRAFSNTDELYPYFKFIDLATLFQ
jgi:hypothetical protein